GINACFEHKSLVTSDIHDRPTHEEVDLAHVKRLRRTLRGHWRTLAQAVCLSRRFGDHPRYDHEHKNRSHRGEVQAEEAGKAIASLVIALAVLRIPSNALAHACTVRPAPAR